MRASWRRMWTTMGKQRQLRTDGDASSGCWKWLRDAAECGRPGPRVMRAESDECAAMRRVMIEATMSSCWSRKQWQWAVWRQLQRDRSCSRCDGVGGTCWWHRFRNSCWRLGIRWNRRNWLRCVAMSRRMQFDVVARSIRLLRQVVLCSSLGSSQCPRR